MKKWQKRAAEIESRQNLDDWTFDALIDRLFDDLTQDARIPDNITAKTARIAALAAELGACLESSVGCMLTSRLCFTVGAMPDEELRHIAAVYFILGTDLSGTLRERGVLPPRTPTEVCAAPDCAEETALERDDHDGGSTYALPDPWAFIETGRGTDVFLPYCARHASDAKARDRANYGLGDGPAQ